MTSGNPAGGRGGAALAAWAAGVAALDQATKFFARRMLAPGEPVEVVPGFFNLTLVFNRGAAWGILAGFRVFFVVLALAMVVLVALRRRQIFGDGTPGRVAAALLAGGVVGNAVDRVCVGYVTDFIDLWHGAYHFPCFNVADSAICLGVALYVLGTTLRSPAAAPRRGGAAGDARR